MKLLSQKSFARLSDAEAFFNKVVENLNINTCLQDYADNDAFYAQDSESRVWISKERRVDGGHRFVVYAETHKIFNLFNLYVS